MLDFDLRDTVAGQQIYEEGYLEGTLRSIREGVILVLTVRFVAVPPEIRKTIYSIEKREVLKDLFRLAIHCPEIEDFRKILSKVSPASNA